MHCFCIEAWNNYYSSILGDMRNGDQCSIVYHTYHYVITPILLVPCQANVKFIATRNAFEISDRSI
jgi:hypothetical protein